MAGKQVAFGRQLLDWTIIRKNVTPTMITEHSRYNHYEKKSNSYNDAALSILGTLTYIQDAFQVRTSGSKLMHA